MPEPLSLEPTRVVNVASELELRRELEAVESTLDVERVARFTAGASAPYRVAFYEASREASSTAALRIDDAGALSLSGIATSGRRSVPLSLIVLGTSAIVPVSGDLAQPSDFAISYLGASASSDYVSARAAFLAQDPARFLVEVEDSRALLAWSVIPGAGAIEPVAAHYFERALGQKNGHSCFIGLQGAHARSSLLASDYTCSDADDFARAVGAFDFGDVRLTRVYGAIDEQGIALCATDDPERDGQVIATDFDASNCATNVTVAPGADGSIEPSGGASTPVTVNAGNVAAAQSESSAETSTVSSDDSCDVTVFTDSCDGDSSSSSSSDTSSSDSCSGDSSSGSDSSSSDSCSGDSSSGSDSSSSDSCSGDSSSGSDSSDSSGCGKSGYDGDTCSGNSASSAAAESTSAALEPASAAPKSNSPKRLHLSLITLFSAALALPLRRQKFLARLLVRA
jgi:hypothetical protein